ncbi:MAG: outer membrane protein assembly factor BamE [Candidatus Zixiibacteriota bacterium]
MKKYIIAAIVIIVCVIVLVVRPRNVSQLPDNFNELCDQVEIGMTHEQVLEILGEPKKSHFVKRDTITEEYWYYTTASRNSTQYCCTFDSSTQQVIEMTCGEHSSKRK